MITQHIKKEEVYIYVTYIFIPFSIYINVKLLLSLFHAVLMFVPI